MEQLIVRIAEENRSWGYDRIAGALPNLRYKVCDQAIGNALPFLHDGVIGYVAGALLFLALAIVLATSAQKKVM